ncbi:MAG: Crp/Fnr family transcriptional regulator [Comamonadaceae bacterium]|nr:MAG: Crp/Fnr family transcriptional regulator [Comamonadaceae bacterium]
MKASSREATEDFIAPSDCAFGVTPSLRRLASDQMLFREGAASAGVFRLRSGCVRLLRSTLTGGQITMHTVREGEFFAEASLFSAKYHCDAVALEPSEVLVFRKEALVDQLRESPELLWTFTAELARRVQGLRTKLEIKQTRSAEERILQFIGLHCDASGFWTQQGTLKHLSEDIGLTHEALYRALARLQRQGAILRLKDGLKICQPGVLAPGAEQIGSIDLG